jgi:hypothetical protein
MHFYLITITISILGMYQIVNDPFFRDSVIKYKISWPILINCHIP